MSNAILAQIDIETLSLHPTNAIIAEIGMHVMVIDDNLQIIHENKTSLPLDMYEQEKMGRIMDVSTVQWWLRQEDKARLPIAQENIVKNSALSALTEINSMIEQAKNIAGKDSLLTMLASAVDLDFTNIRNLATQVNLELGWKFYEQHSQRTLRSLVSKSNHLVRSGNNVHHIASDDAEYQNHVMLDILKNHDTGMLKTFFFSRNK